MSGGDGQDMGWQGHGQREMDRTGTYKIYMAVKDIVW